ncbi:MAG TPA: hypothetical protein VHZ55_26065 [Bryobacteraceae bacterium]|jgi:hypothetical protein|nr:hypothetical protein [Bryobacteraceae bacterium]
MTSTILIAAYVFLLVVALVASYFWVPFNAVNRVEDLAKVATVACTAVSALMAAIVTIINFDRAAKEARKLAHLNLKLQKRLAKYNANLEKQVIAGKRRTTAYIKLFTAAQGAYYTLNKLASETWHSTDKDTVNAAMTAAATANAGFLENAEDKQLWDRIWQKTNFIAERALKLPAKEAQPQFWRDQISDLSNLLFAFQKVVDTHLHGKSAGGTGAGSRSDAIEA